MWKLDDGRLPVGVPGCVAAGLNEGLGSLEMRGKGTGATGGTAVKEVLERVDKGLKAGDGRACVHAGLRLLAGEWEEAHRICQDVATAYGSAWHGVAHRLEGDFWNSKYWWRRSSGGKWDRLAEERAAIVRGAPAEVAGEVRGVEERWDPSRFVDLVERHGGEEGWRGVLVALQRWEWAALFCETWENG